MRCLHRATGLCVTCRPLTVEYSKILLKCCCTPLYGIRPQYKNHIVMLYIYNTANTSICQYLFSLLENFFILLMFSQCRISLSFLSNLSVQKGVPMALKIVYKISCGIDVHKTFVVDCIASTNSNGLTTYETHHFSTYTIGLKNLLQCFLNHNCKNVCTESNGKYCIPFELLKFRQFFPFLILL